MHRRPVSWPRLERFAIGAPDPSIAAHLAACPACRRCLDQIRDIVVSCPPRATAWIDVTVADGASTDHPLAPAQLACGNRVVVPGAFTITGSADNRVCATIAAAPNAAAGTACLTLRPE